MPDHEHITESLDSIGARLRARPSVKDGVLQRITEVSAGAKMRTTPWYRSRPMTAVAGLAACVALLVTVWSALDGGAEEAFAAAIESVKRARTFACREITEWTRDGQRYTLETTLMFKEPDLERHEYVAGTELSYPGNTRITDYARRRRLELRPHNMTASLIDMSSEYMVDEETGTLEPSRLRTWLRDEVISLSTRAVEDLGVVDLDGCSVRMLKSQLGERIVTVWIDPKTNSPVQIETYWPEAKSKLRILYTSIRIDEPLDDELFSLDPPAGYVLRGPDKPRDDLERRMTKAVYLARKCCLYMQNHDNQWPSTLNDLPKADIGLTEEALRTLLAPPGQPDGPPIFRYRPARPDADGSDQIIVYEIVDEWPKIGIVAAFADGHAELIKDRKRFEELTR